MQGEKDKGNNPLLPLGPLSGYKQRFGTSLQVSSMSDSCQSNISEPKTNACEQRCARRWPHHSSASPGPPPCPRKAPQPRLLCTLAFPKLSCRVCIFCPYHIFTLEQFEAVSGTPWAQGSFPSVKEPWKPSLAF